MIEQIFTVSDIGTIHDALVAALDGAKFSDGSILSCRSDVSPPSQAELPCLQLATGTFQTAEYSQWITQVIWDIPGMLRVQGEANEPGKAARRALTDLFRVLALIRGLPIDEQGRLAPYGPDTAKKTFENKLSFLAFRGGPILRQVTVLPENPSDPYATANVVIHVEFLMNHEPDEVLQKVSLVSLGINVFDPLRENIDVDPIQPYNPPRPALSDTYAQSGFAGPDTTLIVGGPGGPIIKAADPPIPRDLPAVEGGDPSKTLIGVRVEPLKKTLAAPQTFQLIGIASYADGSVRDVTPGCAWSSGSPGVATVSASGLLTAVATGSAVITVTYYGLTGTCQVTVS